MTTSVFRFNDANLDPQIVARGFPTSSVLRRTCWRKVSVCNNIRNGMS